MIRKRHQQCAACDRMAQEAMRTAAEYRQPCWTSIDYIDGRPHTARYDADAEEPTR